MEAVIPRPPREFFQNKISDTQSLNTNEGRPIYAIDHFEWPYNGKYHAFNINEKGNWFEINYDSVKHDGLPSELQGIYVFFYGLKYPRKGFPDPDIIRVVNIVKRFITGLVKSLIKNKFSLIGFIFRPYKTIRTYLDWFYEFCQPVIFQYILEDEYFSIFSNEAIKFATIILTGLKIPEPRAKALAKLFVSLIEYDDTYRYRIEDILSETESWKLFHNPRAEIKRLIEILAKRDNRPQVIEKFGSYAKILSMGLLIPKFRMLFYKALDSVDFTKFQYDEADRYHCLCQYGYEFMGRDINDRSAEYLKINEGKVPPMFIFNNGQLEPYQGIKI
jgi:hypothetical protein